MIDRELMVPGSKFQAYGNDFLVVETHHLSETDLGRFSRAVCTAHFGLGADGCIFVEKSSSRDFSIKIFNLDGSQAGMSGNGLRCAAAYLHRWKLADSAEVKFQTISGEKKYRLLEARPPLWRYLSEIGQVSFEPDQIPVKASIACRDERRYQLSVGDSEIDVIPLSVGNPQCVVLVEQLPNSSEFERVGAALECHPFFPDRTNVSFVEVLEPHRIEIMIWERGVGPTHSSGTGSSGAAVAAIVAGKASSPVEVTTATGTQTVEWDPAGEVKLTGDTRFVADFNCYWEGEACSLTDP